ncbi:MAG TPA: hypothetical protein VF746_26370 [Longimicrobium sp.]|jgi:alkylhydroperoxidase family enzyme/proteasome lid subunit RPN8/RPN11
MPQSTIIPLGQEGRPPCSLPLRDADLSLGNANWTKGLQGMSDWIWSGNLNPAPFPNNLARYFLHIPAIFEHQLHFSATLIFDEPSFRNGIQVSGFVDRVTRELCISLIAQRRRSWYSMTHHAVLGRFTANRHSLPLAEFTAKWTKLTDHRAHPAVYTPVEREALAFADAFATDPKSYTDEQYDSLRRALGEDNARRYPAEARWMDQLNAARAARARAYLSEPGQEDFVEACAQAAAGVPTQIPEQMNERIIDAQVVELAFLCMQFVALTGVFTSLNVPDESFLPDVMQALLPDELITRLNGLNALGGEGMVDLVPPVVEPPLAEIRKGYVRVAPAPLKDRARRIPLRTYEPLRAGESHQDLDKGLTVGGVQVGVYGWSFGAHFPGSLPYALMLHPELARFEPPYSLPLLFNEDEWRNGTHTGGFVSRLLKELVFQKIYRTTRSRYGIEHHTMFLFNAYLDEYGVNRDPKPNFTADEQEEARKRAVERANEVILWVHSHENAPKDVFSESERAVLSWTHRFVTAPHSAHELEPRVREELDRENRREVAAGLRRLDMSPGLGSEAAYRRLLDHQIAELAMLIGHMDGLGRALTILRLESEEPAQVIKGKPGPQGGIIPDPSSKDGDEIILTGHFNNRPGFLEVLYFLGVSDAALTLNELLVNPVLNEKVRRQLEQDERDINVSGTEAAKTGEF